ncbi:MAG: hypothetical protein WDN25_22885 [Acetobacteraceae bacterium]
MGALSLTAAIVAGTFIAGITFDMGVNALQNWYDVVYQDAFWSHHPVDTPAMRDLAQEEREIDRLMRVQDFIVVREGE